MKSGRTPLIRARQLEKQLDVGEIYLKLEGNNPSGHKNDRIAEVLIKDALAHGKTKLLVDGTKAFIQSICHMATYESIEVTVPIFKNERWKTKAFSQTPIIDLKHVKYENRYQVLNDVANSEDMYLTIEGQTHRHLTQMAFESLAEEVVNKLKGDVTSIMTKLNFGYTMTSFYNVLLKRWITGDISPFPSISAGTFEKGNTLYEAYLNQYKVDQGLINQLPEHMTIDKVLLENTLQAVYEAKGEIVAIVQDDLKKAKQLIQKTEQVRLSEQEAYALAAFMKQAKAGKVVKGKHVIVLNDAKSIVDVKDIHDFDDVSKKNLIAFTREWLDQYSDSIEETQDAIQNAMDRGYILLAERDGEYEGVCIVVHMGFSHFIPTYHIAYIGTTKNSKGRGVGSELLQRAIDLTGGNVSLHVDLDNKGAKKFYEKYGFKHTYNRMINEGFIHGHD